jgi:hypothetical protein
MPLTVVRAWSGTSRTEWILTFGRGQRATAERLTDSRPLLGVIDFARPGDDFQAVRPTIVELRPSSKVPSDFARVRDAPSEVHNLMFGEVDGSGLSDAVVIRTVKDPKPGSGVLRLELMSPPAELGIDARYPWYAEFRLFETAKDGSRSREVKFKGTNAIVAVGPGVLPGNRAPTVQELADTRVASRGLGQVEVKSPQPWGYEAEIVKWYGVAPKDRLVPDAKGAKAKSAGGGGRTAPTTPAGTPVEETDPPELPDEPTTPSVPESSS